ncbi:MAG: gamma-glutamyltransferase [Candidatus Kapabacteria bacterium]|nr:gamma-glutamyltransferase [Candidatus Kapabacteria bacterium]
MVVTAHPEASRVGREILRNGGNAADAMVAVHFALAVVYPNAGNIGGGGFMIWRSMKGECSALDFREKAPRRAWRDMFLDSAGNPVPSLSLEGALAAGVPGSVDGMIQAHKRYGTMKWRTLLEPAIALAQRGFPITAKQAADLNEFHSRLAKWNGTEQALTARSVWHQGDTLRQPDLAATLIRIRNNGRNGFYAGETARLIETAMKQHNGLIDKTDLAQYSSRWRTPLHGTYRNHTVISMPPPSSGGVALLQLLSMWERRATKDCTFHSADAVHLMVECERRVYADRAKWLGDPDAVRVPVRGLLHPAYCESRTYPIRMNRATPSSTVTFGNAIEFDTMPQQQPNRIDKMRRESEQTTHYSIVDGSGNAVSVTTTLNASYGSKLVVAGAGFLLNNEMDDFSAKPGSPNMYGLLGSEANAVAPGKRMLSSMTPTVVEKDGALKMVVGTPGGGTIITSVFQTILNVLDFGMTMQQAVEAKRFHHQWLPDWIYTEENSLDSATMLELSKRGHTFKQREPIGRVDAILVLPDGRLEAGADPRGDDTAAGLD